MVSEPRARLARAAVLGMKAIAPLQKLFSISVVYETERVFGLACYDEAPARCHWNCYSGTTAPSALLVIVGQQPVRAYGDIPHRFDVGVGHCDRRDLAQPQQPGQMCGVASIGFDPDLLTGGSTSTARPPRSQYGHRSMPAPARIPSVQPHKPLAAGPVAGATTRGSRRDRDTTAPARLDPFLRRRHAQPPKVRARPTRHSYR